jgi:hypothetical protein
MNVVEPKVGPWIDFLFRIRESHQVAVGVVFYKWWERTNIDLSESGD